MGESLRCHKGVTETSDHLLESFQNDPVQNQGYIKRTEAIFTTRQPYFDRIISILYEKKEIPDYLMTVRFV